MFGVSGVADGLCGYSSARTRSTLSTTGTWSRGTASTISSASRPGVSSAISARARGWCVNSRVRMKKMGTLPI